LKSKPSAGSHGNSSRSAFGGRECRNWIVMHGMQNA
jgi:hypothetical protein